MNGDALLDTNIVILGINRGLSLPRNQCRISVITEMELLSFPNLSKQEEENLRTFLSSFHIVGLNQAVKESAIRFRKEYRIKLPDAIICATAYATGSILVTQDRQLHQLEEIGTISLEEFLSHLE